MILKTVYIRFYKSFNFDYLRKHHPNGQSDPWEMLDSMWYPFVVIPIEDGISTVVGANESGKSHLLTAIEKGLAGVGLSRQDFCRYSQFFNVAKGKLRLPDIGFEFSKLTPAELTAIRTACGITSDVQITSMLVFRFEEKRTLVYLRSPGRDVKEYELTEEQIKVLTGVLPLTFRIDADIALPASVPLRWLSSEIDVQPASYEALGREGRSDLFDTILKGSAWFESAETVTAKAAEIFAAISPFTAKRRAQHNQRKAEYNLARDLIRKVAKIDKEAIDDLHAAVRAGNDGLANGIKTKINVALAGALNFPKWWAQDRDFQLTVSPREHDLAFTIVDRTGTEYSFGERSAGLKYFLSYYVQYLAHDPSPERHEILLMDEPDAYLSAQAQQDLLRIFDGFAGTDDGTPSVQVVYVTHSPFLIDKNHATRIRVLEKGSGDEGTRVIRNASKNHYEPLRSAFGAYVGEMAFIGNCNLMVEGTADQILLGSAAVTLQQIGATDFETLDLNKITIVPAGSASHVPYMVFLARGRDVEQPAVIVLLDSDQPGNSARRELQRGGPRGKKLIREEYVLQVGDLKEKYPVAPSGVERISEIEDLIPLPICVEAARRYLECYCEKPQLMDRITSQAVSDAMVDGESVFKALERVFIQADADLHLDKIGFAREVSEVVRYLVEHERDGEGLRQFTNSMRILFRKLSAMQRQAVKELLAEKVGRRVDRARDAFLRDYPNEARKEQAMPLLLDIERALDDSPEADAIRIALIRIRREFGFEDDPTHPVPQYARFVEELKKISYAGQIAADTRSTNESEKKVEVKVDPKIAEIAGAAVKKIRTEGPIVT